MELARIAELLARSSGCTNVHLPGLVIPLQTFVIPRSGATRNLLPLHRPTAAYIDIHRYTPALERPHQPHCHPQPGRHRHSPLRRKPLRRPAPVPRWKSSPSESRHQGWTSGPSGPRHRPGRGRGFSPSERREGTKSHRSHLPRRRRLRRRFPRPPHKTLGAANFPHPGRIQSQEGHIPPGSRPRPYIDGHQYTNYPRRALTPAEPRSGETG